MQSIFMKFSCTDKLYKFTCNLHSFQYTNSVCCRHTNNMRNTYKHMHIIHFHSSIISIIRQYRSYKAFHGLKALNQFKMKKEVLFFNCYQFSDFIFIEYSIYIILLYISLTQTFGSSTRNNKKENL